MLLDLYIYPHPILSQVAEPVTEFDESLATLISNMAETMYVGNGVGLAAPQIGLSKRIFVVDTAAPEEPSQLRAYINPKIVLKDEPIIWNEGCLSLPGLYRDVATFGHVIVEAQDVKGETFREEAHELRAVAILHEYAHLEGQVFVDRLPALKKSLTRKYWNKNIYKLTKKTYSECNLHCVFDKPPVK